MGWEETDTHELFQHTQELGGQGVSSGLPHPHCPRLGTLEKVLVGYSSVWASLENTDSTVRCRLHPVTRSKKMWT